MLLFSIGFLSAISQLLWIATINLFWLVYTIPFYFLALYLKNKNKSISIIITGFCIGFSYGLIHAHIAKSHQLKFIPEDTFEITGVISSIPIVTTVRNNGSKTKFSFTVTDNSDYSFKKILVNWYDANELIKVGQKRTFTLKLKPIHGFKNPGSFDYSKWLFRQGFDATATVKSSDFNYKNETSVLYWIDQKRTDISDLIDKKFDSIRVKGLIQALSIGDKSKISYQDSQLFQETGTAHLIAISGLHIGLIAFIGILFGRFIFYLFTNEKFNRFKFEAIFAITFAFCYALLAGLSIPTVRALVMVVVFSLAHASKIQVSRWQSWSMALLFVLIVDPFSVMDIGFWFSFLAVAVLMFAFSGRPYSKNKLKTFIQAQVVILIGLMPLMAIAFQQINLLTPLANLFVLPLASLLLIPLMFASFLVYLISENTASILFQIVEMISQSLFGLLDYLQKIDFLSIPIQNLNTLNFLLLLFLMVLLLLPKVFRWKFIAFTLILPILIDKSSNLNDSEFIVNVLDVGQGLSLIVQTKDHVLIYDTGAKYESGFSMANAVVIPFLRKLGINHIDKMIISHDDNDHSGGLVDIVNAFNGIDVIGVTGQTSNCQYPKTWEWNKIKFEVLSPFVTDPYLGNNSSCVVKISSKNGSILLTGDIEEPVEYRLINNLSESIVSDVLLVPHHGSRTSSSIDFINHVDPSIAINSSGFANQFNHPHPLIKKVYLDKAIKFYDTQKKGMIEISLMRNGIRVNQYVDNYPHFWDIN